jgi:hypothetical protein
MNSTSEPRPSPRPVIPVLTSRRPTLNLLKHFCFLPVLDSFPASHFMKLLLPTLGLLSLAMITVAHAQEDGQLSAPPDEIVTDFGIEEYLAIPKYTLSIGVRSLSGAKSSFSGRGYVSSFQPGSDITTPGLTRIYQDGNTLANNPAYHFVITHGDGTTTTYTAAPTPAGFSNTWSFLKFAQERPDGNLDFHSYAADVVDSGLHQKNPAMGTGMEVLVLRDMGNLGKKIEWKLLFGASLSDITSHTSDTLAATLTTITDTFSANLNGATALPASPPYTAPSFKQIPRVDATGFPLYDGTGAQIIDYVETTIYIGDHPLSRTTAISPGTVFNQWDLKGAYFTFRLGPSISYLITDHLRFTVSAGAALVYAGTSYSVVQTYQPEAADAVVSTAKDEETKLLAGYFVDVTMQYDFTDRTGIYAGAGFQDTGSYTQTANLTDTYTGSHASYKALVDLSGLSGFRMGMTFRF